MRPIVLNARAATRPELGGVERWAREVSTRLPALALARAGRAPGYLVAAPPRALAHRAGHAWEQLALPALAAAQGARLIVSPANTAPLAWPGNIVVIHDAAALRGPQWYSRAYVGWQRALLPRVARRAVHVVTVSEFSRTEIADLFDVPMQRISVIPGGVDERFSPDAEVAPARAALGLERPYVLTVGSATGRKNLSALTTAARELARLGIELVAAGGDRPQFRAAGGDAGRDKRSGADRDSAAVRTLGYVPERLLPGLYAGATAFVLASRYEGFGLTCLEAMASATPVVSSAAGGLRELCEGAALLVDPDDSRAIAAALVGLAGDDRQRAELRAAGLERARGYGWDVTARALDELLRGLQDGGRSRA